MENGKKFNNNFRGNDLRGSGINTYTPGDGPGTESCDPDYQKFCKTFIKDAKIIPISNFSVNMFHCWFDNLQSAKKSITVQWTGDSYRHYITFERRRGETKQLVRIEGVGSNKKQQYYDIICKLKGVTKYQMESGTDGASDSHEIAASNTRVIVEEDEIGGGLQELGNVLPSLSSTAPSHEMPLLTNRFEVFENGTITVGTDMKVFKQLPKDLFMSSKSTSANLNLFKNFIYSKLELEIKVIINAPKFLQGKVAVSFFPDPHDEVSELYRTYNSLIQREHVILDFGANNEATLRIPQNIRRTFIRNIQHESAIPGIAHANLAELQLVSLAPFRSGKDQPTTIPYQLLYRFVDAKFYGMSYGVNLQMDNMVDLAKEIYPPVGVAEKLLKRTGFIGNQDKPYFGKTDVFVPTPRRNFSAGVGLDDSVPLAYDHSSTVTTLAEYINPGDPKTMVDVAKIPGIIARPEWKVDDKHNDILWEWVVFPGDRQGFTLSESVNRPDSKRPTPLNYASSQYAFWRGTIKLKFQFVGTIFHTGTVQFEVSFNRYGNADENASVYTTIFSLGLDREVEVDVPYIYDTPWRRTCSNVQWPSPYVDSVSGGNFGLVTGADILSAAQPFPLSTEFVSNTRVTMRVLNPLNPIENVSKSVDVLVYVSGGSDFELMGTVPNFFTRPAYLYADKNGVTSGALMDFKEFPVFDNFPDYTAVPNVEKVPRFRVDASNKSTKTKYMKPQKSLYEFNKTRGKQKKFVRGRATTIDFKMYTATTQKFGAHVYQNDFKHFHGTDEATNLKTIMRRNVYIGTLNVAKRATEKGHFCEWPYTSDTVDVWGTGTNTYFMPVYLPAHGIPNETFNSCRGAGISTIPTLFRHWRGSMRYTFVLTGTTNKPITFSYLPNMGVTYMGNKPRMTILNDINGMDEAWSGRHYLTSETTHSSALGLPTEIMIPKVNSSISLTVPFDVMFNRCVTNQMLQRGNGFTLGRVTAREQPTFNSGHILIECEEAVSLEVYQSIGDDLELMNFIGTMEYLQVLNYTIPDSYYRDSDHQTGGLDFQINCISGDTTCNNPPVSYQMFGVTVGIDDAMSAQIDRMQQGIATVVADGSRVTKKIDETVNIAKETSQTLSTGVENLSSLVKETKEEFGAKIDRMEEHFKRIGENFEKGRQSFDSIGDHVKSFLGSISPMVDSTKKFFGNDALSQNAFAYSRDFLFDLVILLRNFDYANFGVMFMKYVAKVLNIGIEKTLEYGMELGKLIAAKLGSFTREQFSGKESGVGSIFGLFCVIISTLLKLNLAKEKKFYDFGSRWMDFLLDPKSFQYMNGLISFVERIFKLFQNAVEYCMDYKNTEESVRDILRKLGPEIEKFVLDVDLLTNPANTRILHRPDIKARIWKNYLFAKYLTQKLASVNSNQAVGVLMKYVNKINSFCEKNWSNMACNPVRYEPRVYCFAGASNIGKSYMSNELIMELLTNIGYKKIGSNPIFTRAPGRKHWDGFGLQHMCVVFDDWMNLSNSEQVVEQIADLYELKSTCDFIPPMAAVEEKGIRANPKLVVLLTNDPFPDASINPVCPKMEAVWRRRDKLIWGRLKRSFTGVDLHACSERLKDFSHLEFRMGDPKKIHSEPDDGQWVSYETMKRELINDFVRYNANEMLNVKKRLDNLCADLPEYLRELVDPMEIYNIRSFEAEMKDENFDERYPSDELEKHVENCLAQLRELSKGEEEPSVRHQGPKVNVANFTPIETTSKNYKIFVPRDDPEQYLQQFIKDVNNHENIDKCARIVFEDHTRRVEAKVSVLEMKHILHFYMGSYGNKHSDIVLYHIHRQKMAGDPFDEHYCPKCYADRCSMKSLGGEFDRVSTFVSKLDIPLTRNCVKHWGENPSIACYDRCIADMENEGVVECLDMLASGFATYYLEELDHSYLEAFRMLINARNVSEALYMEVRHATRARVNGVGDFFSAMKSWNHPGTVFRVDFPKPYEEFSDIFMSTDILTGLMKIGVLPYVGFDVDIYRVEVALNEMVFEDRAPRVVPYSELMQSIYVPHLKREIKLPNPIELVETNDEQFPMWFAQTNNECPEYTTCLFREEYDKRIDSGNKQWLMDYARERENGNKIRNTKIPAYTQESLMKILSYLQADGEFKDDQDFLDIEIELVDGEKRFVSSLFQGAFTKLNVESCQVCDHCRKRAIFQFGNKQHHVCVGCWRNRSVCDYCISHKVDNDAFYLSAFLVPMANYLFAPHRGWLRTIISFLIGYGTYYAVYYFIKALFGAFGLIGSGLSCVFGLFKFFADVATPELNFCDFNENLFADYVLTQLYEDEVCFHEVLVEQEVYQVTCRNERWCWGEDESASHYICKKNCYLGTRLGFQRYQSWCKTWHSNMRRYLRTKFLTQTDSEISQSVPVWTCVLDGNVLQSYKIGRWKREHLLGDILKYFGYSAAMRLGANPTTSWLKILLSCSVSLITVIGAIRGIYHLVKFGMNKMSGERTEQSGNAGYSRAAATKHFSRKTKPNVKTKMGPVGTNQNQSVYFESLVKKIYRNQILMVFEDSCGNRLPQTMALTGIRNRIAVLPKHFYLELKNLTREGSGVTVFLLEPNNPAIRTRTYVFSEDDFLVSDESDICLMKMPKVVQEFVNILPYFQTAEDCEKVLPATGVLLRCPNATNKNLREIQTRIYGYEKSLKMESGQDYYDVLKHGHSENGACGSLLLKDNSTRPIIGIHFAGTGVDCWMPRGFCVPLSQSTFESVDFMTGNIVSEEELETTYPVEDAKISLDPGMVELQNMFTHEKEVHLANKTKIIPSLCHYYDGEPKTRQCFLSKLEPDYPHEKSPLVAGVEKHGRLTKNFATHEVNEVRDALFEAKYRNMKPLIAEPKKMTAAEAIRGFEINGYEPLRLNTSAGYPFVFNDKKQKKDYIKVSDEQEIERRKVWVTREMADHLAITETQRLLGERPMLPFVDENKDERKPFEKIFKLGGTRVFCMSPVSNTVWSRASFLHFAAAYKANRETLQHAVGIAREGPQWGQLARRLLNNSQHIVTLDYSNFGPGYNAMVNAAGHDIVTKWTKLYVSGVSDVEMEILGEEHYNCIHIAGDLVYKQMSGGPSGDALTVVKNGLVNELYILLAWRGLALENKIEFERSMYTDYFDNVVLITYGDDAIISIKPGIIDWFNGETISKFFAKYNIVATDAEKSGQVVRYRTLEESTFLKSGFVRHPLHLGEWCAPLDLVSVTECPRWCYISENRELATEVNCEQGLRLAYGHGKKYFYEFRERVNASMAEAGLSPLLLTWEELDRNFFPMYYSEVGIRLQHSRDVGEAHIHRCEKCEWYYNHYHTRGYKHHGQRPNQCPNPICEWYHRGNNPTYSHLLTWVD